MENPYTCELTSLKTKLLISRRFTFLFHYRLVLIDFKGNSIIVQLKKVLVYFNVKIGMISILNS